MASAADSEVLPLPGASSISRWPSATIQASAISMAARRPRNCVSTAAMTSASREVASAAVKLAEIFDGISAVTGAESFMRRTSENR